MAWIETESLSFVARHEAEDSDSAQRTLDALEDLRLRLEERFDEAPAGVTVIVHPTPGWLAAAHPFLPAARLAAASAGGGHLGGGGGGSGTHRPHHHLLHPPAPRGGLLPPPRGPPPRPPPPNVGGGHKRPPP